MERIKRTYGLNIIKELEKFKDKKLEDKHTITKEINKYFVESIANIIN